MMLQRMQLSMRPTLCYLSAIAVIASTLLFNDIAVGQNRHRFKELDVVVNQDIFNSIGDLLNLSESQLQDAQVRFDIYSYAVQTIDAETHKARLDAGLDELNRWDEQHLKMQDPAAKQQISDDGLDQQYSEEDMQRHQILKFECNKIRLAGRKKADEQMDALLSNLALVLELDTDTQDRVRRFIWRRLFSIDIRNQRRLQDGRVSIDLLPLVELASQPDGELYKLLNNHPADASKPTGDEQLRSILDDYELELDQVIHTLHRAKYRRKPSVDQKLIYEASDPEFPDLRKQIALRFARRYDVIASTSTRIANLLEMEIGSTARAAWEDRVNRTLYPLLYKDRRVDRIVDWLAKRPDATSDQLEHVKLVYEDYVKTRRQRRVKTLAAAVRLSKHHFRPDPLAVHSMDLAWGRRALDLHLLSKRTIRSMISVFNPEQIESLRDQVLGAMSPGKYGPLIQEHILKEIDSRMEYKTPPSLRYSKK